MKINKWICTVAIGALFASCQSVDLPTFSEEDTFVALQAKSFSVAENAGSEFKIPVNLVAISARDLTVNFEIDTTAYAGVNAAKPGVHYNLKNKLYYYFQRYLEPLHILFDFFDWLFLR